MQMKLRGWNKFTKEMKLVTGLRFNDDGILTDVRLLYECKSGGIPYKASQYYPAEEVILMMSVCINDRDGQEIFEGDVCQRADCPDLEDIRFMKGGFSYCVGDRNIPMWWAEMNDGVQIVGNIYQNPELLK